MMILIICALLLAALWTAWVIGARGDRDKLTPQPVRVRYDTIRRR
jgi:hypothetical protein